MHFCVLMQIQQHRLTHAFIIEINVEAIPPGAVKAHLDFLITQIHWALEALIVNGKHIYAQGCAVFWLCMEQTPVVLLTLRSSSTKNTSAVYWSSVRKWMRRISRLKRSSGIIWIPLCGCSLLCTDKFSVFVQVSRQLVVNRTWIRNSIADTGRSDNRIILTRLFRPIFSHYKFACSYISPCYSCYVIQNQTQNSCATGLFFKNCRCTLSMNTLKMHYL